MKRGIKLGRGLVLTGTKSPVSSGTSGKNGISILSRERFMELFRCKPGSIKYYPPDIKFYKENE